MNTQNFSKCPSDLEFSSHKAYTIGGVPVLFPYKAYPSQITMMDKIIKCLNKKQNCLLESPTGSGKSLALLCAALGWLKKTEKQIAENDRLLNQHLNAHGVIAPEAVDMRENHLSTKIDFHQFKYSKENDAAASPSLPLKFNDSKQIAENKQLLDSHLNDDNIVTNETVPLSVKKLSSKLNCQKSKITKNNVNATSPVSTSDISCGNVKSKYFKNKQFDADKNLKFQCFIESDKNKSLKDTSIKNVLKKEQSCMENKRGIIYIDDDDDFQPMKKSKLFASNSSTFSVSSENLPVETLNTSNQDLNLTSYSVNCNMSINSCCESNKTLADDSSCSADSKNLLQNTSVPIKLPKIYFGTRTHKQIEQIIRELKKTPYKNVQMTILSSRERTCIHPINSKAKNKNEGCDELIKLDVEPGCHFYKNFSRHKYNYPPEVSSAFDLEDFVSICKKQEICPYYGSRELLLSSQIIFCPYNYLVDPIIRSAMNITLNGNIIIMDEAHNIEDSAREAANLSVTPTQLHETILNVLEVSQFKDEDAELYRHIAKVLENLKKWLESSHDLKEYVSFDSASKVFKGNEMIAILDYVGLGPDTFPIFMSNYAKINQLESDTEKNKNDEYQDWKLSGSTHMCLKGLVETLNYLYRNKSEFVLDFRMVIRKSKNILNNSSFISPSQFSNKKQFGNDKINELTFNFWCLNPAVVFTDMKDIIHSLIVASGTLSPLTSFQSELGLPFQITLEANHVIAKENLWIGTIGKGPSNSSLLGTYHNASTFIYQDDIGNIVYEVSSIIPHGVLCFLPSYGMLDNLVNRWKLTGLWDKLSSKKIVFCEPRRANEYFQQVIQDFYGTIKDSEDGLLDSGINGALLFAVCRGKISEGTDFPDNNARAVITVGIPFPNIKDAQVDLKKKYNDQYSSKRSIVSGSQWYEMQAFRALNQALGRCIRHRNDFGALIIVDERFQKMNRYIDSLSKWIRQGVKHYPTFGVALHSLNEFSEKMGMKVKTDS